MSPRAPLHVVGMLRSMSDINQPSLPTPFYSALLSVSVFTALSTVFHSINSPDNSASSLCSSSLISALLVLSTISLSLWKSPSALDTILCGWLGLKHQPTNKLSLLCNQPQSHKDPRLNAKRRYAPGSERNHYYEHNRSKQACIWSKSNRNRTPFCSRFVRARVTTEHDADFKKSTIKMHDHGNKAYHLVCNVSIRLLPHSTQRNRIVLTQIVWNNRVQLL